MFTCHTPAAAYNMRLPASVLAPPCPCTPRCSPVAVVLSVMAYHPRTALFTHLCLDRVREKLHVRGASRHMHMHMRTSQTHLLTHSLITHMRADPQHISGLSLSFAIQMMIQQLQHKNGDTTHITYRTDLYIYIHTISAHEQPGVGKKY